MRLGHFDLNLLLALDTLLETASVTKAAERLHIGTSATSSALGRLREHFADELLVQVGRRMELTPLAIALKPSVRDILVRAQATIHSKADFDPARAQRRFVLHVSDYAATVLIAPLAQRLESSAPGISLHLITMGGRNLERLERGDVDLAIYPADDASADHPQRLLLRETFCCVVWAGYAGAPEDRLDLQTYLAARHVAVQLGDERAPTFEARFLESRGLQRQVVVTAGGFNALPGLVVGTQRIATLHSRLAHLHAAQMPLRVLAPPVDFPAVQVVMQWNRHRDSDAAHAWLRQQLLAVAATL